MLEPALAELAESCGLEPGYHDIWGVWREADAGTVRSLLSAMGVEAADATQTGLSLKALKAGDGEGVLPLTLIVRRSALAQGLKLRLPASVQGMLLKWRVTEERGTVQEASAQTGNLRTVQECGVDGVRRRFTLLPMPDLCPGYHQLEIAVGETVRGKALLVVAPDTCYLPEPMAQGARVWGVALQLYSLRSARNWGIGDFSDLADAIEHWGRRGAAFVGVNPLHALYLADPEHASPYSPSSRNFLNPIYLDVEAIDEFRHCAPARALAASDSFAGELKRLRDTGTVDYAGVAELKKQVLAQLHAQFASAPGATGRKAEYEAFCRRGGEPLQRFAIFEALHEHFRAQDVSIGSWMQWPQEYHDPASATVAAFARQNADRIGFFLYLQWQAAAQLGAAQSRARATGLGVGLYLDLAVSIDRGGADAWSHQALYALRASVGAPPDDFNRAGQDWGLPPCNPVALQRNRYASFIETLRANMACAGALRIDHVMGLARLFWMPLHAGADKGAYVRYPLADLLGIIALESEKNRCTVIGEDLGTVPVQLRHALREWGVLSYRLMMFERDSGKRFQAPSDYPSQSLVAFSTHDLPTFAGYWQAQPAATREALCAALRAEALLPNGITISTDLSPRSMARLCHAVHLYLARSPAMVLAVQLDDLAGATAQANVPGTPDAPPNWRRKLPMSMEEMRADTAIARRAAELGAARAGQ